MPQLLIVSKRDMGLSDLWTDICNLPAFLVFPSILAFDKLD